jgi:hypothetical protein
LVYLALVALVLLAGWSKQDWNYRRLDLELFNF